MKFIELTLETGENVTIQAEQITVVGATKRDKSGPCVVHVAGITQHVAVRETYDEVLAKLIDTPQERVASTPPKNRDSSQKPVKGSRRAAKRKT